MYRTPSNDRITPERALAESGALDPATDELVSVREIVVVLARVDVELGEESGPRVRTREIAFEGPAAAACALGNSAPTTRVDAGALPACAARAVASLSKRCAESRTVVVALGADVREERVIEALVRRGRVRRTVWVGTSPVRLLACEPYRRVSTRARALLGLTGAVALSLASSAAVVMMSSVPLLSVPSAVLAFITTLGLVSRIAGRDLLNVRDGRPEPRLGAPWTVEAGP